MEQISLWKLAPNGNDFILNVINLDPTLTSLDDISAHIPGGVYTTFRTFEGNKALPLRRHFNRLEESSRLAGKTLKIDYESLRNVLRKIVNQTTNGDLRLRITIDLECEIGCIFISTEPLQTPSDEIYRNGGTAITFEIQRENPQAKLTDHLNTATEIRKKYAKNIHEILALSEEGTILEGLSSNFFAIRNGEIWTENENVLHGTVRRCVLDLASKENIPIHYQGIRMDDLESISEAFITSTSRSILPITVIDEHPIMSGKPGVITKRLVNLYKKWVQSEIEFV